MKSLLKISIWTSLIIACFLGFQTTNFNAPIRASSSLTPQLPNDLVFTGKGPASSAPTLALLDATTLEVTWLYTDETAKDLRVMSWSPDGNLMAVLRIDQNFDSRGGFPTSLCIMTLSGSFQTCFEEKLPEYFEEAPMGIDYNYTVTWSSEGDKVYFVTEDESGEVYRLVEADVTTGEILQVIYEASAYNDEYVLTLLTLSPDLSHLVNISAFDLYSGSLIDLRTSRQRALSEIHVSPIEGVSQSPINIAEGTGIVCNSFSLQGTYLAVIDTHAAQLILVDTNLLVNHVIESPSTEDPENTAISCPAWSEDETTVYFPVRDLEVNLTSVFAYSLETRQLTRLFQGTIYPPLEFSPDRSHFAFDLVLPSRAQIHVVYPDGEIRLFGEPFQYARYPVWRPLIQ